MLVLSMTILAVGFSTLMTVIDFNIPHFILTILVSTYFNGNVGVDLTVQGLRTLGLVPAQLVPWLFVFVAEVADIHQMGA